MQYLLHSILGVIYMHCISIPYSVMQIPPCQYVHVASIGIAVV